LVAAMQSGNTSLQAALDAARQNVNDCAAKLFQELVSPSAEGAAKFGDVRISSRGCECGASDENLIHCSGHPANPASVASRRPCPAGRTAGGFRRDGTCYFRTGFGPVATAADRTASFDLHRANLINDFMASHQNIARRMDLRVDSGPNNRLNSLSVCMTSGTFGDLSDALSTTPQNCPRTLFAANSPAESLGEWMRAAEALRLAGEDLAQTGSPLLDELLAEIDGTLDLLLTTEATITGRNVEELLDLEFGKNRPWLQTARGRGTLIGGGIGALAGIGYYFAEGKSVFCNVGGMGQPRLNGTFSIPTFRQYIISRNYMNLDEMNPPE
ncbi:MAG: hypothetical protein FWE17_02705, partial [Alphaproteobacteria bacterium]|nr:hypothetical protein [Alphaproteobacteria bacterium]